MIKGSAPMSVSTDEKKALFGSFWHYVVGAVVTAIIGWLGLHYTQIDLGPTWTPIVIGAAPTIIGFLSNLATKYFPDTRDAK